MKKNTLIAATLLVGCSISTPALAIIGTGPEGYITRAGALLETGNAVGALDQLNAFERLQGQPLSPSDPLYADALYLRAQALFETDNARCLDAARQYIELFGATPEAQQMRMLCGDYCFYHADYEQAYRLYDEVQGVALDPEMADALTYRRALTTLRLAQYDTAEDIFNTLLGSKQYADPARFYLAYIAYIQGNYREARKGFEQYALNYKSPSNTGRIPTPRAPDASYYLAQIDFAEGYYSDVAARVPSLLKQIEDPATTSELNRICGESLYNLGQADRAESYLRKYLKAAGSNAQPSAQYIMGVICYNQGEYQQAANMFEPVAALEDATGQSASLYLGQCEMKLGEPAAATVAFERAYRMNYDPKVSEAALYNYAAMLTTGSNVPFARSSVDMLEQFVRRYPDSEFAAKADEYLAGAYFNEKDYRRALESINRIQHPSNTVLQAKQKILYELGVETLTNGNPKQSITYMSQAAAMTNVDTRIATRALLWLGDAYYNQHDYAKAAQNYRQFLQKAPTNDPNRSLAQYDLGYALYQQDKFADAKQYFEGVVKSPGTLNKALVADARTRVGDCLVANGQPSAAMAMYEQAMQQGANNADYAALQRANMLGMMGQNKEKVDALLQMIGTYPKSTWVPSATLELAQTYIALQEDAKAIEAYKQLVAKHPNAPESRQGLLQLAITYANKGHSNLAEQCYKEVICTWPTSEEAQTANQDLRMIYARNGQLQQYAAFLESIPGAPKLDINQIDRLAFEAAENAMLEDENDIALMQQYINQFPDGAYLDRALYSVAEVQYGNGQYNEALRLLEQLRRKRGDSRVAPQGALIRAQIYEYTDIGSKQDALKAWRELLQMGGKAYAAQAYGGIMRNTDDPAERVEYANLLTRTSGLTTEEMEQAIYYRALGELGQQLYADAVGDLKQLADNPISLYGSMASIELAEHYMATNRMQEAQKLLEDFTDSGTPHNYWLARGYIDLADVYHNQGRKTLAKQYIQSLKDNYPGSEADILQMIDQRLAEWK